MNPSVPSLLTEKDLVMIRSLVICLMLLLPLNIFSQSSAWDRWSPDVVKKLNTGMDKLYLTEEEKKVILFMNMARYNGSLFAESFLDAYIRSNNIENTTYVRSLYRDLSKISDLPLLLPEEDLTAIAQDHATKSGKTGRVGHQGMTKRFEPFMGNPYYQVGENCAYGFNQAIDIVITLLIDEGIKGTGHRENTLNEGFNSVGVAIRPHRSYRVNCVIDLGRQIRSDLNQIPY